jgi:Tol biopolymer transport system component
MFPAFLPDGRHFLYTVFDPDETKHGIYVAALGEPKGRRLLADQSGAIYAPPYAGTRAGHLMFLREGALVAQAFDTGTLQLAGEPFVVQAQASATLTVSQPAASASATGSLALIANQSSDRQLIWRDRTGRESGKVGARRMQRGIALSPDGKTIGVSRGSTIVPQGWWLHDLVRNTESRLVADADGALVWSPDGTQAIYSWRNSLYLQRIGDDKGTLILSGPNPKAPSGWSRDGRFLLYTEVDSSNRASVWYLPDPMKAEPRSAPIQFLTSASQAQFSPDGHWVAYWSANGVSIRSFPPSQKAVAVSVGAGQEPRWSADGTELYYFKSTGIRNEMMAVAIRAGRDNALDLGLPQKLFEFSGNSAVTTGNQFLYSPTPDGRFLINESADTAPASIDLIQNWRKFVAGAAKDQ